MSGRPVTTLFADDVYAELEPMTDPDEELGFPLLTWCGAVGTMFQQAELAVRALDGYPAWSQTLDIDRTPDFLVAWLGQFVGVPVAIQASVAAQRQQVRAEGGFIRGRPETLIAAVAATLTGTQRVRLVERTGAAGAYGMELITSPAETPDPDYTALVAQQNKAGGLILDVEVSDLPTYDEATRTFDAAAGTFDGATLADVT